MPPITSMRSSNPGGVGSNVGSVSAYAGWHTFGAYWTAGHVQFDDDGVSVGSLSTDSFTGPHYLIFDYTSSGPPDAGLTMLVDWVRVWNARVTMTTMIKLRYYVD